jgi:hypothetical protein
MLGSLICRIGMGLAVVCAVLAFAGCFDDDPVGPSQPQAPALPDVSTMEMDLSFFDQTPAGSLSLEGDRHDPMAFSELAEKTNFMNAAFRVQILHLAFCAALTPPVSAFALAIHSVPQLQPDGCWLWTYIYVKDQVDYSIFLFGKDVGDRVQWRMEVSTDNPEIPLDHFVWFDGEVLKYESAGYWQFYEPVVSPPTVAAAAFAQTLGQQSIRMDWRNLTGNVHQLSILNNKPDSADEGDLIVFHASPAVSSIDFTDSAAPNDEYNITWYVDGSGSIQVLGYNDGLKACWDTNQFDVVCPE